MSELSLLRSLSALAAVDVVAGRVLARSASPVVRGFGRQTALWGEIDGVIAAVGALRRRSKGPTEPARLRRVLPPRGPPLPRPRARRPRR